MVPLMDVPLRCSLRANRALFTPFSNMTPLTSLPASSSAMVFPFLDIGFFEVQHRSSEVYVRSSGVLIRSSEVHHSLTQLDAELTKEDVR